MNNEINMSNFLTNEQFDNKLNTVTQDIRSLESDVKDIRDLYKSDLRELKDSIKSLERFMYRTEGGRVWLFSLLTAASALGGTLTAFLGLKFK